MSRRGRKRKAGSRYPNGNPVERSAVEREHEVLATAINARQRVFGLSVRLSKDARSATAVGRLSLSGAISEIQWLAAEEYHKVVRRYQWAILAKRISSGGNLDKASGFDSGEGDEEDYVDKCQTARRAYSDARRELLASGAFVMMAVDGWVIEDTAMHTHVGDLRLGLNALVRLYKVEDWRRSGRRAA